MNIMISSSLLTIALIFLAGEIGNMASAVRRKRRRPAMRRTEPVRSIRAKVPADWDRIMMETELSSRKTAKKKAAPTA